MVETESEPRREVDIHDLILQNRKRTFKMFCDTSKDDQRPPENMEHLKMKLQVKINA